MVSSVRGLTLPYKERGGAVGAQRPNRTDSEHYYRARNVEGMIKSNLWSSASRDRKDLDLASSDFGGMIRKAPVAVSTPANVEEVSSIVRAAVNEGVQLAIRGGGHSQGGQSLSDRGVVVETRHLDHVQLIGKDLLRAQGGAQWGKVVAALEGTKRLPAVLVDIGEATVGGTLSAAGFGTTSHRRGVQIEHVEQLEVVTGTGERVLCSPSQHANLFNAVRGGQGQFGIITEAWIRLRKTGSRVRQYQLVYRDFDAFADDFERLVEEHRFDHLRAETRIHTGKIAMGAGIEYDEDLDDADALKGLRHDEVAWVNDTADVGRAEMYPKWGFSGGNYHPWRDWFMPWEALRTLINHPWLDPRWAPRAPFSWTGMYPIRTGVIDTPLFSRPQGPLMTSYSILAVLSDYDRAADLTARLKEVDRALVELGGKSYLSGHVGYGLEEWEQHYGEKLAIGKRWKRQFDPDSVFESNGMPFAESPTATDRR